jgi:hypothetical protein
MNTHYLELNSQPIKMFTLGLLGKAYLLFLQPPLKCIAIVTGLLCDTLWVLF